MKVVADIHPLNDFEPVFFFFWVEKFEGQHPFHGI
jgi:hypothetical protein